MSNTWADGPFNPSQKVLTEEIGSRAMESIFAYVIKKHNLRGEVLRGQQGRNGPMDVMSYSANNLSVRVFVQRDATQTTWEASTMVPLKHTYGKTPQELDGFLNAAPQLKHGYVKPNDGWDTKD